MKDTASKVIRCPSVGSAGQSAEPGSVAVAFFISQLPSIELTGAPQSAQ
jgi:hypothetical protein